MHFPFVSQIFLSPIVTFGSTVCLWQGVASGSADINAAGTNGRGNKTSVLIRGFNGYNSFD